MSARPLPLRERLRGPATDRARPLLLGPSPLDVFEGGQGALVEALRRAADAVIGVQRRIVDAGADLLVAPTAGTTAPALHQTGQAYRAAALTAAAVDLTRDAAFAARTHAGVLGEVVASSSARGRAEARTHVERLATSAIDGVLVWGDDPEGLLDVVRAAAAHGLPALMEI
ncbi:MAG: homocysteine S-methyltransferase family protein, partial [Polyangiales bacterium]